MDLVSIVIPVYNEAENLSELLGAVKNKLSKIIDKIEVIIVDDGSRDESSEVLDGLLERYSFLKVVRLKKNFGQTAAISAGFEQARGEVVVTMDGDLQNDPEDIPKLVGYLEDGYDVASGWRKKRKDAFLTRRLPSAIANKVISWYTGVRLHDYGCSLKAYKKELLSKLSLYGELHRFIPALLSWNGAKIIEVPVKHHARKRGVSKYDMSRTVNVIMDLITVKFLIVSINGPMQIFGRIGFFSIFLSCISGLATIALKLWYQMNITGNPLLYLSIFLGFVGMQFIIMGLLGELNMRTYAKIQKRKIFAVDEIKE